MRAGGGIPEESCGTVPDEIRYSNGKAVRDQDEGRIAPKADAFLKG